MCGIAGLFYFESERAVQVSLLDRMTDVLAHRGPDGRGVYVDGSLGLGHRRLAIIDLSDAAAQPLSNEDGTIWVALNGEIYNFRELRRNLQAVGHVFRSQSDTEVLVHLYEEEGPALVEQLRGMFAFALWDGRKRKLLLARDRFGQKPLYYRLTADSIHFGSEVKAILEDPGVPRQVNLEALQRYLTFGYVPDADTAFSGIRKLLPGHTLEVDSDGRVGERRYWQLRMAPKHEVSSPAGRATVEDRLLELLDEATAMRLVADVPLGAFLSGGIDSSAVVASMCARSNPRGDAVKTFCVGFREQGFDESAYAALVADHLATEHRRLEVSPEDFDDLERIAWHYGEPFADSSCIPSFALARLAREHVTVALTGDGGDELFAGYRRYLAVQIDERLARFPRLLRAAATHRLPEQLLRTLRRNALARHLEHNRRHPDLSPADLFVSRLEALDLAQQAELCSPSLLEVWSSADSRDLVRRAIDTSDGECLAERCAHADVETYLPGDILVKVDVASMASGLECRAPLLDHVLAEFVAQLPFALKISRGRRKALLKAAVSDRLPREILRRRKRGFGIPLQAWFQGGLDGMLREALLSSRALGRGYFKKEGLEKLLDLHSAGKVNLQRPLFVLLMLEIWHRQWIDG